MDGVYAVRKVRHRDGRRSYWIFTPEGDVHRASLNVLKRYGTSSQQTYAYSLVDHLNWLHLNHKSPSTVTLDDLQRYMNGLTDRRMVFTAPFGVDLGSSRSGHRRRAMLRPL